MVCLENTLAGSRRDIRRILSKDQELTKYQGSLRELSRVNHKALFGLTGSKSRRKNKGQLRGSVAPESNSTTKSTSQDTQPNMAKPVCKVARQVSK
jgi:hypothetical protein